jgi:hypothetical protein
MGPLDPGVEGGVTQSLLSKFMACRERLRLCIVNGLAEHDHFRHRIEYGSMFHICEEAYLAGDDWADRLLQYCRTLAQKYPTEKPQIHKWYRVCKLQFPIYLKYWSKTTDEKGRTPLLQEGTFHTPYKLPSGRTVYLRGKWDGVDLIGGGKVKRLFLQENKTKGEIEEGLLKRQLDFDHQTMFYAVALQAELDWYWKLPEETAKGLPSDQICWPSKTVSGVRYNVIRRPISGGKYTIKQHQPTKKNPLGESEDQYYDRLGGLIKDDPDWFFARWQVTLRKADLKRYQDQVLDPILEQVCDWYEHVSYCHEINGNPFDPPLGTGRAIHWRTPYGLYDPLAHGRPTEMDEYMRGGSTVGLDKVSTVFPELN